MEKKQTLRVLGICFAIFCGILLLSRFYQCPLYALSGVPCPGCGMTRAFFSLLQLDFVGAWNWNPAVYLVLLCSVYAVICCLVGRCDLAKSFRFWSGVAVFLILIWLLRFPGILSGRSWLQIREDSIGEWVLRWLTGR